MGDITLEQVKAICGEYTNKSGYNYFFQCPICMDSHKDNLVYNSDRQIIKCFANEMHTNEILALINKKFNNKEFSINHRPLPKDNFSIKKPEEPFIWDIRKEQYLEYMVLAQNILSNREDLKKYILDKRGLKYNILDLCGIGFDDTENFFTIPIFSLRYDCITDFELRAYGDKKQIRRIGGGCNTIAKIYGKNKSKTLYIVEGFIDGITLTQWLLEKYQTDFTVYSCSNGVSSLINVLDEIFFNNFNEIKLILDNDKAGDKATEEIIKKYPFMKDCRKFLINSNCKDINEYFLKYVVNK